MFIRYLLTYKHAYIGWHLHITRYCRSRCFFLLCFITSRRSSSLNHRRPGKVLPNSQSTVLHFVHLFVFVFLHQIRSSLRTGPRLYTLSLQGFRVVFRIQLALNCHLIQVHWDSTLCYKLSDAILFNPMSSNIVLRIIVKMKKTLKTQVTEASRTDFILRMMLLEVGATLLMKMSRPGRKAVRVTTNC